MVHDPATGDVLTTAARGAAEDVDRAVLAARRAFDYRAMVHDDAVRARQDRVAHRRAHRGARRAVRSAGEPRQRQAHGHALAIDVALSADHFRYMAGWATKVEGTTIPISVPYAPGRYHAYTVREPIGVVGAIVPWDFPLLMATWKLSPALATGNTVVLKPAEQTPLSAALLTEVLAAAGVPDGVVNVVYGYGEEAGAALVAHPAVDKIAFTGSTEVGRHIIDAARGNLKKVTLELGGKSPNVLFADADLEAAIPGAAQAIFFNQGEVCTAASRLYVQADVFDDVVDGASGAARQMKLGHGLDPTSEMGPLVSNEQLERVPGYLEVGEQEGATTVTGGRRRGDRGYFLEPTVVVDTTRDMRVVREEIFGPVVVGHAVPRPRRDRRDGQRHPVRPGGGGVDEGRFPRPRRRCPAQGRLGVGQQLQRPGRRLPLGGYKQSGWGRENGAAVLDAYTETKPSWCRPRRDSASTQQRRRASLGGITGISTGELIAEVCQQSGWRRSK
jgi:acyl-CoA reductase-like NAD-dependent aldehyde dehydrogenase